MWLTLADNYYLKAKVATQGFGGDWEEATESLNYALSYNQNHCPTLCLLGKIYVEQLSNYEEAFQCFDKVIAHDINYLEVYPMYAKYLLWADKINEAQKLLVFAFTIKGIDKAELYGLMAYALEMQGNYKIALKMLKKAKLETYNENHMDYISEEIKRVKKKMNQKLKEII